MEKATNTSYRDIDQILKEMHLKKIEKSRVDEYFENLEKEKESRFFRKASRVLVTLWELTSIVMKNPGKCLVIDCDSGRMFTAKISPQKLAEKFTELPEKVPGRVSLEIDGNGNNERYLSKVGMVNFGKSAFKKSWNNKVEELLKVEGTFDLYLFEEKLKEVDKSFVTEKLVKDSSGHEFLEISIKDYPTKIGVGPKTGRVYYTETGGEKEYLK